MLNRMGVLEDVLMKIALRYDQSEDPKDHVLAKFIRQSLPGMMTWSEEACHRLEPADAMMVIGEAIAIFGSLAIRTELEKWTVRPGPEGLGRLIDLMTLQLWMEGRAKLGVPEDPSGLRTLLNDYEQEQRASAKGGASA